MRWRARAGIAFAVLGFLTLGSQPVARWIVCTAISRFVPGEVTVDGTVRWDPMQHAWSCGQFRFQLENGQTLHAERMTVRMDPKEFLRRNLVVDSAQVEGITIRASNIQITTPDEADMLREPSFSIDNWIETVLNHQKSTVLSTAQDRDFRKRELQKQLNHLRERCDSISTPADTNPLISQQLSNEVRQEIVLLIQAIAEERIRVRELNQELLSFSEQWRNNWRAELSDAIVQSSSDSRSSAHLYVKKALVRYLGTCRDFLSIASAATRPMNKVALNYRGTDIALPGLPRNFVLIRNANLSGQLVSNRDGKVHFQAQLSCLGDTSSEHLPKSDWRFEPASKVGNVIEISVEGLRSPSEFQQTELQEHQQVSWRWLSDSALSSRAILTREHGAENVEMVCPIEILANRQQVFRRQRDTIVKDWHRCWDEAVLDRSGRLVAALWKIASEPSEADQDLWEGRDIEIHPNTLSLADELWTEACSSYLQELSMVAEPRIPLLISAIEPFLDHSWSKGMQPHYEALAELERDAIRLKARWITGLR